MALIEDTVQRPPESTRVWSAGNTSEQDLVTLSELDGRDQLSMIALFREEEVVGF